MAVVKSGIGVAAGTTTTLTPGQPVRCCRHQIDVVGPAAGSMAVGCNFGAGARAVGAIDFTDTERVPFVIEAEIDAITLTPTGLDAAYAYSYRAEERR